METNTLLRNIGFGLAGGLFCLVLLTPKISQAGMFGALGQMVQDTREAAGRFQQGYGSSGGHVGDRLIEGMIETATPQADEQIRRVQRDAVKFAVDPHPGRAQSHHDSMKKHIEDMLR